MAVDTSWRWIAWLILGIGGLIAAGGVAMGLGNLRHVLYGERADGVVTEIVREGDMYAPVVRFRLPQGETVEVKDLGSGRAGLLRGRCASPFSTCPRAPQDFRLDTFERLWLMPIILTGFGGFWPMFGAIAWALSRNADLTLVGERAFSVISVAALLIGIFVLVERRRSLCQRWPGARHRCWKSARTGPVVTEEVTTPAGREVRRDVERLSYAPVVRFTTPEGREIEFHGRGGSGTSFAAGDVVNVVYDRAQPSRARIMSFLDLWLPAAVAFAVALIFGGAVRLSRWSRRTTLKRS